MINFDCLEEVLTPEEFADAQATFSKLPTGVSELLRLMLATQLSANQGDITIVGDQWITGVVHGASSSLTIPDGATGAFITPYSNDIFFVLDGGNAHGGQAHYLQENNTLDFKNLSGFKFAAVDSSSAVSAYVTYYR